MYLQGFVPIGPLLHSALRRYLITLLLTANCFGRVCCPGPIWTARFIYWWTWLGGVTGDMEVRLTQIG